MVFPPVRTLVLGPTSWHSIGTTPSITLGDAFDPVAFPLTNLTDGSNGPVFKFATTAAGINIPVTEPSNVLGLLNHNLDPSALVEVYIDGVLQSHTFSVRYPNSWIDLRAFEVGFPEEGVTPGSSIGIKVYGNSKPVNISEIVVGQATGFNGLVEVPFPQGWATPTARHWTEGRRKLLEWGSGVHTRAMRLNFPILTEDDVTALRAISEATVPATILTPALKVVVVPSSRQNDIWLVHWPASPPIVYTLGGLGSLQLDLIEDATGGEV